MDFGPGFRKLALGAIAVASFFAGGNASAQVVSGTLGQPSATTTIKGNQIPAPAPPFGGVIKENATDSKRGGRLASFRRRARPTCCSS